MTESKHKGTPGLVFDDEYITVGLEFDSSRGAVKLKILEKQDDIGLYYIDVMFDSGDSVKIQYDGANPARNRQPLVATTKPNAKGVKMIEVKRAR